VFNNFQDTILTLGTIALVANIVAKGVMMKEKPNAISHDSKFSVSFVESLFINLCGSSDKNGLSFPNIVVLVFVNSRAAEK